MQLHYITLHYTPLHSITLHYTPLHYITLKLHYITLYYTTWPYITPHYTTLCYIMLHYTTLHYITLYYTTLHYITLHYTTLHYITLHYTTLHYITLHYTTKHKFSPKKVYKIAPVFIILTQDDQHISYNVAVRDWIKTTASVEISWSVCYGKYFFLVSLIFENNAVCFTYLQKGSWSYIQILRSCEKFWKDKQSSFFNVDGAAK